MVFRIVTVADSENRLKGTNNFAGGNCGFFNVKPDGVYNYHRSLIL
jgi:hypothetical protein